MATRIFWVGRGQTWPHAMDVGGRMMRRKNESKMNGDQRHRRATTVDCFEFLRGSPTRTDALPHAPVMVHALRYSAVFTRVQERVSNRSVAGLTSADRKVRRSNSGGG